MIKYTKVYVISNGNYLKIGISKNPQRRLKQLQTGSPNVLFLLGYWTGLRKHEQEIHAQLKPYLTIQNHEWFDIDLDKVLPLINRITQSEPEYLFHGV